LDLQFAGNEKRVRVVKKIMLEEQIRTFLSSKCAFTSKWNLAGNRLRKTTKSNSHPETIKAYTKKA